MIKIKHAWWTPIDTRHHLECLMVVKQQPLHDIHPSRIDVLHYGTPSQIQQVMLHYGTCHVVHACVQVCMCGHTCVCVISGLSILFKIFPNSLSTHTLYTHRFALIFATWDYFYLFLCTRDIAQSGSCDQVNQLWSLIFTSRGRYVGCNGLSSNYFKMT